MPQVNKNSPLVSVVIPCFNGETFISETISSVLAQSYSNIEIIVIDDGSTDNTFSLVEAHVINSGRKNIFLHHKRNTGVSDSRNYGLILSKGAYVLFLDADDVIEESFIQVRVEQMEKNPELVFTCSNVRFINQNSNVEERTGLPFCVDIVGEIVHFKNGYVSCPSNYLFRSSGIKGELKFNGSLSNSADKYFLLEVAQIGRGALVIGGYLRYRVHSSNMSGSISMKNILDMLTFHNEIIKNKLIPIKYYFIFKYKILYIAMAEAILIKSYNLIHKILLLVLFRF